MEIKDVVAEPMGMERIIPQPNQYLVTWLNLAGAEDDDKTNPEGQETADRSVAAKSEMGSLDCR